MSRFLHIKIEGEEAEIEQLLLYFGAIQWCGNTQNRTTLHIPVDGTTTGRLRFYLVDDQTRELVSLPDLSKFYWSDKLNSIGV
jgi:hypothetical protein